MPTKPRIEIETFIRPCRTYGCTNKAKYKIGNMSGTPLAFHHVCEKCLRDILHSAPKELLPGYKPVANGEEAEEIKEVEKVEEIPFDDPKNIGYREMQKILKEAEVNATGTKEELTKRFEKYMRGELE